MTLVLLAAIVTISYYACRKLDGRVAVGILHVIVLGMIFPVITFTLGSAAACLVSLAFDVPKWDPSMWLMCCTLVGLPAAGVATLYARDKIKDDEK